MSDQSAKHASTEMRWGLALSGGGIRSASFALGVLKALASCKMPASLPGASGSAAGNPPTRLSVLERLQIMSTVSGGGFTGGFLTRLLLKLNMSEVAALLRESQPGSDQRDPPGGLSWMRAYSNYLTPRKGLMGGDTLALLGRIAGPMLIVQLMFAVLGVAAVCVMLAALALLMMLPGSLANGVSVIIALFSAVFVLVLVHSVPKSERPKATWLNMEHHPKLMAVNCFLIAMILPGVDTQVRSLHDYWPTIPILGFVLLILAQWTRIRARSGGWWPVATLASSAVVFGGLYATVQIAEVADRQLGAHASVLVYFVFAPSALAVVAYLALSVFQVLAGAAVNSLEREIWARSCGRCVAMLLVGWTLPLTIIVATPLLLAEVERQVSLAAPAIGSWLLALASSVLFQRHSQKPAQTSAGRWTALIGVVPYLLLLLLFIAIAQVAWLLLNAAFTGNLGSLAELAGLLQILASIEFFYVGVLLLLALVFSAIIDANRIGNNMFYADRLARAFLGAARNASERKPEATTGFDPDDDVLLAESHGPFPGLQHLICTAANVGRNAPLDWQDRRAASFVLSAKGSGHESPELRKSEMAKPMKLDAALGSQRALAAQLSLARAMAISGAAVNPGAGFVFTPGWRMLLTVFNARLGWWVPNNAVAATGRRKFLQWFPLLAEFFGYTDLDSANVHLSDGGHFENLGIYELVRRRCRFIIATDCGADPNYEFEDLGRAVRLCRVDLGAEIRIDVSGISPDGGGRAKRACAVGTINYVDGAQGIFLLLKPVLTGQEPADVRQYAVSSPKFPQHSTADQFFDDAQFESYRQLGFVVAAEALRPLFARDGTDGQEEELLNRLVRAWTPAAPVSDSAFSHHAQTIARIFEELGKDPELAYLVDEFYPEWGPVALASSANAEPELPSDSRLLIRGFGLCQSLIQLMEQVFLDLKLDRFHDHPDNQGWMNVFHHWSWSPTFRLTWVLTQSIFGARFVDFCERHLELDEAVESGRVVPLESKLEPGLGLAALRAAVQGQDGQGNDVQACLNHYEIDLIETHIDQLAKDPECASKSYQLCVFSYPLRVKQGDRRLSVCVGYSVLERSIGEEDPDQEWRLLAIRIRDHLRKLGHSRRFQAGLAKIGVIADGERMLEQYGELKVTRSALNDFAAEFNRMASVVQPSTQSSPPVVND